MKAGPRNRKIVFQRRTVIIDDYGGEITSWTDYAVLWGGVIWGTGAERREAAQLSASQPATFRVLANSETLALSVEDRISFAGGLWNITSVVPLGLNEGVEVTAIRAAA
ncbi:phage head closure protein [Sphingobium cupriresistens]|uniref:Head-tail adaptor protein n=1 Tax=Sphingobium cupriresistens TaxID=1132417 RepID=A0A8G1ZJA3_9SPHN|nr:phage head closure protein [Sphingobium cupriresistens]RYM12878.1 head-tail adaptor protein [Sphingobium cupriresistens]